MQIRIFTFPLCTENQQTEELNHFLRAHKVVDIRKELAIIDGNNVWTFCVTYMQDGISGQSSSATKSVKIDYKEVLDEETFKVFSSLRKSRKLIADSEAVPAYAVFTDAELAEIAKLAPPTIQAIQRIPGIGKKKVEKYAEALLAQAKEDENETAGIPD